jgi:hypothetical protein
MMPGNTNVRESSAASEAAMAGKKVFRLWLMDQLRTNENNRWDASVRQTIEDTLRDHFQKVLASQLCAFGKLEITWEGIAFLRAKHGYEDTDIVLHFLDNVRESILRNRFGVKLRSGSGHSGATQLTPEGMLSEIHVWENENGTDARLGKLIGNLAFHEAMHNKLQAGNELHKDGGLAADKNWPEDTLNDTNIRKMRGALETTVIQDTQYLSLQYP